MGAIIFVLLLLIPIAELYVIVQVSDLIGVLPTLLLLVMVSIAGAFLLRHEGTTTWRRMQETLSRGEMPTREVVDGALILLGGALLLTPGFISDVVGLILLFPPTRVVVKGVFGKLLRWIARRRTGRRGPVYSARVVRVERASTEPSRPEAPARIPDRSATDSNEDGSPGRE